MSCSSAIAAYSDAGPAWLLFLTPTQAVPAVLAFSIAVFAAKLITTCPMPLSPSTSAMPAASRATRTFGFTLTAPPRILRTYCGRRKMPWPSAPWRSARTISSAQVAASFGGRPTLSRASATKPRSEAAGRRGGVGSAIFLVHAVPQKERGGFLSAARFQLRDERRLRPLHRAEARPARAACRVLSYFGILTSVTVFTRLLASTKLPSFVTEVLRTMLPPPGIVQLWNFWVLGSKRTTVFGLASDSLYQMTSWIDDMP